MATRKHRWGRAIGAGVLVPLVLVVSVVLVVMFLKHVLKWNTGDLMAFTHPFAAWFELIAGPITTFVLARWALRPLGSAYLAPALVVAAIAVVIHVLLFYSTVSEGHSPLWSFVLADALKVAAAFAAARFTRASPSPVVM